jgi:acyl-homoserine lactone synthase
MLQVHVIDASNASRYGRELRRYHEWRHLIYVEERGWSDLRRPDGLERDEFDTDDAVHLVAMEAGEVVGGSRMIPMSVPTLLSEVFPFLVERGEVPSDAATIEWTRMFVVPARRKGAGGRSVAGALFTGVMEYCVAIRAERVGGVMETFWLPRWRHFGWTTRPFGLAREIAGSMTLAAFTDVGAAALAGVRAATGWRKPVLVWPEPAGAHKTLADVACATTGRF